MSEKPDMISGAMEAYDDLAINIIDSARPNTHIGLDISNIEMVEYVCHVLSVDDFSLFSAFDFENAYQSKDLTLILAHIYLAHLRFELFSVAQNMEIGDKVTNDFGHAQAQCWFLKLCDHYNALSAGEVTKHRWLH